MADEKENIWWLTMALKYRDREGQSCFSPSIPVSRHSFGWERKAESFVIRDNLGIAGYVHDRLPVPIELAEKFLLRCLDGAFRQSFLTSMLPSEDAEEAIEHGDVRLRVHRSHAVLDSRGMRYIAMPSLSLSLAGPDGKNSSITLFDGLRRSLGNSIAGYAADSIRFGLREKFPDTGFPVRAKAKTKKAKRNKTRSRRRAA